VNVEISILRFPISDTRRISTLFKADIVLLILRHYAVALLHH